MSELIRFNTVHYCLADMLADENGVCLLRQRRDEGIRMCGHHQLHAMARLHEHISQQYDRVRV